MQVPFKFRLVFSLLMSCLMSAFMTGWVTWLNVGLTADYFQRWGHAFLGAWPAAFIVVLTFAPSVQRLTAIICKKS